MGTFKDFNDSNFIRTGGAVSWEYREAQPADFTSETVTNPYADKYANNPDTFFKTYANWQAFADYFVMRRAVYTIKGKQKCRTKSFKANDMENYTEAGKVTVKNFEIPGGFQDGSIPDGKWLNIGMSYTDHLDTTTTVEVEYEQRLEWELVKIQDGTPPNPLST